MLGQQAEKFVRQLQWQRKQKELRDQQKVKLIQAHLQGEFERIQNTRKSGRFQSLDLGKRIDSLSNEQQSFNLASQNDSDRYTRKPQIAPLYKIMEKRYEERILFPELERRKHILSMRHKLFKPLGDHAFQSFQEQYQQEKLKYEIPKHREQQEEILSHPKPKRYHSKTIHQVVEFDELQKNEDLIKLEEKKKLYQKKVQYGRAIKEIYFPMVVRNQETKLKQEAVQALERLRKIRDVEIIEKERNSYRFEKPRFRSDGRERPLFPQEKSGSNSPDPSDFRILPKPKIKAIESNRQFESGFGTFDSMKTKESQIRSFKARKHSPTREFGIDSLKKTQPLSNEFEFTQENSAENKRNYPNYLEELKRERREIERKQEEVVKKKKQQPWDRYIKDQNLSCAEKVTYVLNDAKILEDKAKLRYDRLLRRSADISYEGTNEEETIDELFVSAIKAKLAVLKEINEAENLNNKTTL